MVFVRKVRTASGATAVQVVEKRRGKLRVIKHVGSAHTDAELGLLMDRADEILVGDQGVLDLGIEDAVRQESVLPGPGRQSQLLEPAHTVEGPPVVSRPRTIGAVSDVLWFTLEAAYTNLGFDVVGDEVFKQVVLARLVEPTSKRDTVRVLTELGVPAPHVSTIYRHLARAQEKKYRGAIASKCFAHCLSDGDVSLVMYDVTTLYFEAEHEDGLRKVGYSKERRVDPQIVVGLLVDRTGFPLEIGCFEGNKAETKTLLEIIERFQTRHGIADMVVVAGAGMLLAANLKELDEAGLRFIVGSKVTKAPNDLASHFRWHGDGFTDGQIVDTVTPRYGKTATNDVLLREEPAWNPEPDGQGLAGSMGILTQTSATGSADPEPPGLPCSRDHRRATPSEVREVRQDHSSRAETRRSRAQPGSPPGRTQGLRHEHPRHDHARQGDHQLLSRPVAGRAVLPNVEVRPCSPADLPPHPQRDRSPPDHRVHHTCHRPPHASQDRTVAKANHHHAAAHPRRAHRDQRKDREDPRPHPRQRRKN